MHPVLPTQSDRFYLARGGIVVDLDATIASSTTGKKCSFWDGAEIQPTPQVLLDEAMLDLHEIRHRWRSAPEVLLHGKLQSLVTTA